MPGSRLLADLADRTTLTGGCRRRWPVLGRPRAGMTRGGCWSIWRSRSLTVRSASPTSQYWPTSRACSGRWRRTRRCGGCSTGSTRPELAAVAAARAAAREVVWAQRAEVTGAAVPAATPAGVDLPGLVVDVDASIVVCHSEKESAAATFKSTFGYHPILAFLRQLRGVPGRAAAARQRRREHRRRPHHRPGRGAGADPGRPPARCPGAGARRRRRLLEGVPRPRPRPARAARSLTEFSVGWAVTDRESNGDRRPARPGLDRRSRRRRRAPRRRRSRRADRPAPGRNAGRLPARHPDPHPPRTPAPRRPTRRLRTPRRLALPVPRHRHRVGQLAFLDARHRAHARVEDRIRCGKDTGLGRFPSRRAFAINAAWLTAVMLAVDLIAWAQTILLHDQPTLAEAEPKTLRYRLLHVAARLVRGGRRLRLRLDRHWPWAHAPRPRLRALRRPTPTRPLTTAPRPDHRSRRTRRPRPGDHSRAPPHHYQQQDPQAAPQSLMNDRG